LREGRLRFNQPKAGGLRPRLPVAVAVSDARPACACRRAGVRRIAARWRCQTRAPPTPAGAGVRRIAHALKSRPSFARRARRQCQTRAPACACGCAGVRRIAHVLKTPPFPLREGRLRFNQPKAGGLRPRLSVAVMVSDARPACPAGALVSDVSLPTCGRAGVRRAPRLACGRGGVRRAPRLRLRVRWCQSYHARVKKAALPLREERLRFNQPKAGGLRRQLSVAVVGVRHAPPPAPVGAAVSDVRPASPAGALVSDVSRTR
jgi:hypothetical protein